MALKHRAQDAESTPKHHKTTEMWPTTEQTFSYIKTVLLVRDYTKHNTQISTRHQKRRTGHGLDWKTNKKTAKHV